MQTGYERSAIVSKKETLREALADWRDRGLLDSLDESEFGRLVEDAARREPFSWKKPLIWGGIACFLAGLVALCSTGAFMDIFRRLSPQSCALAFFIVSIGLRVRFRYCERRVPKIFLAIFCCASMIAASFFLGEYAGHKAPWLLLAGIYCAFIPTQLAALFAVLAMGFGLCLLPGKIIPVYEFRIMLFAFSAAALAFAGKIPARFRQPGMLKGLGALCHYILKGNFPHPDMLVLAGVAVAGLLFWLSRKSKVRELRTWGCIWGLAMIIVETVLHLDGRFAVAAVFEILCVFIFLLAWKLDEHRRRKFSKEKEELPCDTKSR